MKLEEVPFLSREVLQARVHGALNPTDWYAGEVVVRAKDGHLLMRQGAHIVTLANTASSGSLAYQAQNPLVLWHMTTPKTDRVSLRYLLPQEVLTDWVGRIAVDTRTADALKQSRLIPNATVAAAMDWLTEEFLLQGAPEDDSKVRVLSTIHERVVPNQLQWLGRKHTLELRRDEAGVLWVERVAARKHNPDQAFVLVEGAIGFVDTQQDLVPISAEKFQTVQAASSSFGSYLELWQLYGTKEWQRALKQAADIGAFYCTGFEPMSDEGGGWRLLGEHQAAQAWWHQWQELAGADEQAEVSALAPDWHAEHHQDPTAEQPRNTVRGSISWHNHTLVLETNGRERPPKEGYVYLSLAGQRTAHKRRIKARQLIEAGHGVPALKALLQDLPTPKQRPSNLNALTPYALASFHLGKPTERQADALHVALNTPDIALIIGPPGTGKTQVIAALERRLSEDSQGKMLAQQVLISSYQHDAVENALERTDVYGLPAIKVGGSRRREGTDPVLKWCARQLERVDVQREQAIQAQPDYATLLALQDLLATLQVLGALPEVRPAMLDRLEELLKQLNQRVRLRLPSQWWDGWQDARQASESAHASQGGLNERQRLRYRRQVRALRTLPLSFLDDGPQQVTRVLASLATPPGLLTAADQDLLQQARVISNATPELLHNLAELQKQLLDRLQHTERSVAQRSRLPDPMLKQLKKLEELLAEKLSATRLSRAAVLTRYTNALEEQPERVKAAVERYSSVVGATCQQAASRQMALLKDGNEDVLSGLSFDSVVIDEAARANPLDLFVPMALARRRIILVGDPRQLPHLLDSEIEEEIQAERGPQADSAVYKQSLFERLHRQLEQRQADDRFPRVVMLNIQFRMHPRLGDFVSRWFYERPGLGAVKSPVRPASDFAPTVPGFGAVVGAWIDVPADQGREERHGTSRRRMVEAKRVAKEVARLLNELPADMSLGVITFYAAQRDAIFEALARLDVSEKSEQGWRVLPAFATSPSGAERLRIGTVDAFQGKEFDVVLLSAVRSNQAAVSLPANPDEADDAFERQASGRYGHLRSANRLNVAMSRQRRLLVAVGDEQMFRGEVAQRCVPEMHAFLQLCDEEANRG